MTVLADLAAEGVEISEGLQGIADAAEAADLAFFLVGAAAPVEVSTAATIPAFSDPIAIALGVVAICIAVGFKWPVAMPIAWVLGKIPFIGGTLAGWVQDVGEWEWQGVQDFAHAAMQALWWLGQVIIHFVQLPVLVIKLGLATASQVYWLVTTLLPHAVTDATNYANGILAQAETYADVRFGQATGYALQLYDEAIGHANDLYNSAVAQLMYYVHWLGTLIDGETAAREAADASILTTMQAEIGDAVQRVELDIGHATTTAEDYAAQLVGDLNTQLTVDIGAGVAVAVAIADGIGNTLKKFLNDCGDDLCSANGQNAKNVNRLTSLIKSGAVFGFFAAAIRDPEGTARVSAPVLVPVGAAAGTLVDDVVGVVV